MKKKGSWRRAVIGILAICMVLPATLFAQGTPAKTFKQEELDQLLAAGQPCADDARPLDAQVGADVLHLDHMHIAIGHLFDRRAKGVARLELGHLGKYGSECI